MKFPISIRGQKSRNPPRGLHALVSALRGATKKRKENEVSRKLSVEKTIGSLKNFQLPGAGGDYRDERPARDGTRKRGEKSETDENEKGKKGRSRGRGVAWRLARVGSSRYSPAKNKGRGSVGLPVMKNRLRRNRLRGLLVTCNRIFYSAVISLFLFPSLFFTGSPSRASAFSLACTSSLSRYASFVLFRGRSYRYSIWSSENLDFFYILSLLGIELFEFVTPRVRRSVFCGFPLVLSSGILYRFNVIIQCFRMYKNICV